MPYLREIMFKWDRVPEKNAYPFNIPSLLNEEYIKFNKNITFFVGENGCGKSTLLEAIAVSCGFAPKGGGRNNILESPVDDMSLASILKLSWLPKIASGFFLRAETFFDFASHVDEMFDIDPERAYIPYGGKSLHKQSHGEAFLSLMTNRFSSKGLYILDEPEAALSPQRQLALLRIMWQMEKSGRAQFIIATHSPILMAYPGSDIYCLDEIPIKKVEYESTEHYQLTRRFMNDRERIFRDLFSE